METEGKGQLKKWKDDDDEHYKKEDCLVQKNSVACGRQHRYLDSGKEWVEAERENKKT